MQRDTEWTLGSQRAQQSGSRHQTLVFWDSHEFVAGRKLPLVSVTNSMWHLFWTMVFMYYSVAGIRRIGNDLGMYRDHYIRANTIEFDACASHYVVNRCGTASQPPAIANQCLNWKLCMESDPEKVNTLALCTLYLAESISVGAQHLNMWSMSVIVVLSVVLIGTLVITQRVHRIWVEKAFVMLSL
ncbi:Di-sulfide bridge nucleocytoplasmic transport domain-containing protein [Panaeolus papilionaceus]|nr:Di-sulfide bridge nucleocytoplasmic transport domain-containing protein [Panaeolus papilionaceus]